MNVAGSGIKLARAQGSLSPPALPPPSVLPQFSVHKARPPRTPRDIPPHPRLRLALRFRFPRPVPTAFVSKSGSWMLP